MAVTPEGMHDARDAEDALLLEQGDHATLLAAWQPTILQLCRLKVPGDPAWDVAQDVCERLLRELRRGKRYPVPYRVVVHNVVKWTVKEHFQGRRTDVPLPDDWDPATEDAGYRAFEADHDLGVLLAELPPGDREVAELRYCEGLEIDQIAERLGKTRNAVDQALWRANARLRRGLADAG
jgi:RNA polymerase sigma factor (sigma-70 family)